tara:strand:+ start:101 stop:1255 length:1155 start_codon:yes stop_codon:yes gene_type:complete
MFLLSSICFISCRNNNQNKKTVDSSENAITNTGINAENFKGMIGQDSVRLYTLSNRNGLKITFSNYGQRLVSLYAPDINGKFEDVVLGFPTLKEYTEKRNFYGATVGRYGNRIGKAKFSIGDEEYNLAVNNGENHLHGGNTGFDAVVWKVDGHTDHEIVFSRVSPDMEEGYPGNLSVQVKYELNDDNELKISYSAETDKTTVVNLTHHSFFNLKGEGNGDVIDHVVMINADRYTPVDPGLIPTGSIEAVKGTPFDFKEPKPIGKDIEADNEQLIRGKGYDHNFVLNDSPKNADGLVLAAKVVEPLSGRTMEVYTDEPGVQFYTGNFMDGKDIGKSGKTYGYRGAFCFETQHFPDSPNIPDFPSTLLKPGETYVSTCVYKFGTVK